MWLVLSSGTGTPLIDERPNACGRKKKEGKRKERKMAMYRPEKKFERKRQLIILIELEGSGWPI